MRDCPPLWLADVRPPLSWPEVASDSDCFDGLCESDFGNSGGLRWRGNVRAPFFFGTASKLSVGAVVMMDGAIQANH